MFRPHPSARSLRSRLAAPLLVAALVSAACVAVSVAVTASAASPSRAPQQVRRVIVGVDGDAANGFEIHYADGSDAYPPTDSESIAECGEYDRRAERIRCRTEVRTWYRDLGDLQATLAWVVQHRP